MPEQFEMRSIHLLSSSFKESKKDEENRKLDKKQRNSLKIQFHLKEPWRLKGKMLNSI
jgi:hypothetical protein